MAKWASYKDCGGAVHELRHFHDTEHTFQIEPTVLRPKGREVTVRVTFGMHCFTRDPREGEAVLPCQVYHRNKEGRLFCEERTHLGKDLPGIIASILDRNCFETDRKNHVLFSSAQIANGDEYAVFFTLRRASNDVVWDANMMVLSAHPRRGFRPGGKPKKFRHLLRAVA